MFTYKDLYTACQRRSRNSDTTQLLEFKKDINQTHQLVCNVQPWKFLETTADITTVDGTQAYELPINLRSNKITEVEMRVSSTVVYHPRIIESAYAWEELLRLATSESDVTQYVYVYDEKIYCYPTPATSALTLRVRGRKTPIDMTLDDYTTGTIVTAVVGDETIVGSGTTWTGYGGCHLRITKSAAANVGDGFWYEISSVTNATNLELVKKYAGTAITAGSAAYTIGQLPLIPDGYQDLLIYRPLALYFNQNADELNRADRFWMLYDGGFEIGKSQVVGGLLGKMMNDFSGVGEGFVLNHYEPEPPSLRALATNNDNIIGDW
jgi:hypothetical protein